MSISGKIAALYAFSRARVFGKKVPFVVTWQITRRCNARCKYCTLWEDPPEELDTGQVLSIIRELGSLGTRMIHFTGGEALLRSDFGRILRQCHSCGIKTSLSSNGALVPARIDELATLRMLGISIDGPEEVHDSVRGAGSYQKAVEALGIARRRGLGLSIMTVLSRHNLDVVDFLLERAMEFGAPVVFQPATAILLGGKEHNPVAPDVEKYRRTIEKIILKKKGKQAPYIANSLTGLRFLYDWPRMKKIRCLANLVSFRIESDGQASICYRNELRGGRIGQSRDSIRDAFVRLPSVYCDQCCCASRVELNCLLALKPGAILNTWRSFHRDRIC